MKSKQIVLTLGYIALFCIALYFVFGILKISGQGLSSMTGGPLIEGMTDKQREKAEKTMEKINENMEKVLENNKNGIAKTFINYDNDITGFNDFKDNLLILMDYTLEAQKNLLIGKFMQNVKRKKNINFTDKEIQETMRNVVNISNFKKFLEEHEDVQV
tara:strand:+ start:4359 stop:4835 length:477 start_codon:yes stop_codon:yes gene_type:complete